MKRKELGPSDFSKMLRGLRQAAEKVQRDEFDKIVAKPRALRCTFPGPSESEDPSEEDSSILTLCDYDRRFLHEVGIDFSEETVSPR